MKLVIQIPCYNEAEVLPMTLRELPRSVEGCSEVIWQVIDDGSEDGTAEVARQHGVDHVVRLPRNQGLARAFSVGIEHALQLGADFILNTDADNQYPAHEIPKICSPVITGQADLVIGKRPISETEEFSLVKKCLQFVGSRIVAFLSGTPVGDAPSGFRCMTREVAERLHVFNAYTYTLETIIQAGKAGYRVLYVPIETNASTRPSRLVKSSLNYVMRSTLTILRVFALYNPVRLFVATGLFFFGVGFLLGLRFLYYYLAGQGDGMVQSLIFAAVCMLLGFQLAMFAMLADLIAINRNLIERVEVASKRQERQSRVSPSDSPPQKR